MIINRYVELEALGNDFLRDAVGDECVYFDESSNFCRACVCFVFVCCFEKVYPEWDGEVSCDVYVHQLMPHLSADED